MGRMGRYHRPGRLGRLGGYHRPGRLGCLGRLGHSVVQMHRQGVMHHRHSVVVVHSMVHSMMSAVVFRLWG